MKKYDLSEILQLCSDEKAIIIAKLIYEYKSSGKEAKGTETLLEEELIRMSNQTFRFLNNKSMYVNNSEKI